MVGVPGKGGIMIYDVTELESTESGQAAMEKWDMTNFTNITDDKGNELKTMPYYFKKMEVFILKKMVRFTVEPE